MAVAQGECPSCGAAIEFGVGSSIAKICEFCRATVMRTDRGLQNLGKVAEIALTPSLIAVGDQGTLGGRPFEVLGRVQLDHGKGPWDEYYVGFDHGQAWGWLAYAQGHWYSTGLVQGCAVPPLASLGVEMDLPLSEWGSFRVAEIKTGTIVSAEGELPGAFPPGFVRHYVDCYGAGNQFATIDYGDQSGAYQVFVGRVFLESEMTVSQAGPRHAEKVSTDVLKCPSCGGDVPKLSGQRAERVGCPYCHAVTDIASQQVVAQQDAAMQNPEIPLGSHGPIDGVDYVAIAYVRRSTEIEGERFSWEEYLLWSQAVGYRWLVKDEGKWLWVTPVNLAELDLSGMPNQVVWGGRAFRYRNATNARVDYVLGEVYWKCAVGETTSGADYVSGSDVLSREESPGEVRWSYAAPVVWAVIAQAFGLSAAAAGGGDAAEPAPPRGKRVLGLALGTVGASIISCGLVTCGGCTRDKAAWDSSARNQYQTPPGYYQTAVARAAAAQQAARAARSRSSGGSYRGGSSSRSSWGK